MSSSIKRANNVARESCSTGDCPLLAAIYPVRYAIGTRPPKNAGQLMPLQFNRLGFPSLSAHFPLFLNEDENSPARALSLRRLQYTTRTLRDGWFYVFNCQENSLCEYQVIQGYLIHKGRGSGAPLPRPDARFLVVPVGSTLFMCWSPIRWSDSLFKDIEVMEGKRRRLMQRVIVQASMQDENALMPAHHLDQVIEEYRDKSDSIESCYGWSQVPLKNLAQQAPKLLESMESAATYQGIVVLPDALGITQEIAGLHRIALADDQLFKAKTAESLHISQSIDIILEKKPELRTNARRFLDESRRQTFKYYYKQTSEQLKEHKKKLLSDLIAWNKTAPGSPGSSPVWSLDQACDLFDTEDAQQHAAFEHEYAVCVDGIAASGLQEGEEYLASLIEVSDRQEQNWLYVSLLGRDLASQLATLTALTKSGIEFYELGEKVKDAIPYWFREFIDKVNQIAQPLKARAPALTWEGDTIVKELLPTLAKRISDGNINKGTEAVFAAIIARTGVSLLGEFPQYSLFQEWIDQEIRQSSERLNKKLGPVIWRFEQTEAETAKAVQRMAERLEQRVAFIKVSHEGGSQYKLQRIDGQFKSVDISQVQPAGWEQYKANVQLKDIPILGSFVLFISFANLGLAGANYFLSNDAENQFLNIAKAISATISLGSAALGVAQGASATASKRLIKEVEKSKSLLKRSHLLGFRAARLNAWASVADVFIYSWESKNEIHKSNYEAAGAKALSASGSAIMATGSFMLATAYSKAAAGTLSGAAFTSALSIAASVTFVGLAVLIGGLTWYNLTPQESIEYWLYNNRFGKKPKYSGFQEELDALYRIYYGPRLNLQKLDEMNYRSGTRIRRIELRVELPVSSSQSALHGQLALVKGEWFFSPDEREELTFTSFDWVRDPQIRDRVVLTRSFHLRSDSTTIRRLEGNLFYQVEPGFVVPLPDINVSLKA